MNKQIPTTSYVTADGSYVSAQVFYAIKAAAMRRSIGRDAAIRYALAHGTTRRLYRIACQLHAIMQAELAASRARAIVEEARERNISNTVAAFLKTPHSL